MGHPLRSFFFTLLVAVAASSAQALPETSLGTRLTGPIVEILKRNSFAIDASRAELSKTGIATLDSLWDRAAHFKTPACSQGEQTEGCLWMSRFDSGSTRAPVVILPGFTEYRKQYLEFVADLQEQGYGPIYVLDFRSHGQSFKPFLKNGEKLPTVGEFVADQGGKVNAALEKGLASVAPKVAGHATLDQLRATVTALPVGFGDGRSYEDFASDVNVMLSFASQDLTKRGATKKITVIAHSTGGMAMLVALGKYAGGWLSRLERVVLMVPLVGVSIKQGNREIPSPLIEVVQDVALKPFRGLKPAYADRGIEQFVNKALGVFAPDNAVSHSPNRLTLSDSIRVWNGHETVGGTRRWVSAMLGTEYRAHDLLGTQVLNRSLKDIRMQLKSNGIEMIIVAAGDDTIARTQSTEDFVRSLSVYGQVTRYCDVEGARHVIHQESDLYRKPLMNLLGSWIGAASVSAEDARRLRCQTYGL